MSEYKYKIGRFSLKTKKDLISYTRNLIIKNYKEDLTDNEREFIFELIKFHPDKNMVEMVEDFYTDYDFEFKKNLSLWVELENGDVRNISYMKCIGCVRKNNLEPIIKLTEDEIIYDEIDFQLPFGKYKDEKISEIYLKDKLYIEWLLSDNFLEKKIKFKFMIKRYLIEIGVLSKNLNEQIEEKPNEPEYKDYNFEIYNEDDLNKALDEEDYELAIKIRDYLKIQNNINKMVEKLNNKK